jgi:hypothetical protein
VHAQQRPERAAHHVGALRRSPAARALEAGDRLRRATAGFEQRREPELQLDALCGLGVRLAHRQPPLELVARAGGLARANEYSSRPSRGIGEPGAARPPRRPAAETSSRSPAWRRELRRRAVAS